MFEALNVIFYQALAVLCTIFKASYSFRDIVVSNLYERHIRKLIVFNQKKFEKYNELIGANQTYFRTRFARTYDGIEPWAYEVGSFQKLTDDDRDSGALTHRPKSRVLRVLESLFDKECPQSAQDWMEQSDEITEVLT